MQTNTLHTSFPFYTDDAFERERERKENLPDIH